MKTAIVTGPGKGIGKPSANVLTHDGFTVVVADADEPEGITAAVASGLGIGVDVSDSGGVRRMAVTVLGRRGSIDVPLNGSGCTQNKAAR
jgi:NAD(P)-dependent dehydrogenase (short-subunit alcohol dehydrogenase family)